MKVNLPNANELFPQTSYLISKFIRYIIGERMKRARVKAGLSQKGLSESLEREAVYVCRGSVSRIENGERTVTDIEIDAIARVLKVSLDYLFGRCDE